MLKMATLEEMYPYIAEWVAGWGWIELGDDGGPLGVIRVLDEGGQIWESGDKQYATLDEIFLDLERFLAVWMEEHS
jgi:hypothetical protein